MAIDFQKVLTLWYTINNVLSMHDDKREIKDPASLAILDTGKATAATNMALDAKFLENFSSNQKQSMLHLYDWERPSATYGYFINPFALLNNDALSEIGLDLAKRPTGGGIIFHMTDFAFSLLVPASHPKYSINTLENYAFVNGMVIEVIKRFTKHTTAPNLLPTTPSALDSPSNHFCMAKPTKYDVMLNGCKVGGAAQRRTRYGFLHQGTLSLAFPDQEFLNRVLLPETRVQEAMSLYTATLLPGSLTQGEIEDARLQLKNIFKNVVRNFC